jgi:hypothetical protein
LKIFRSERCGMEGGTDTGEIQIAGEKVWEEVQVKIQN